MHSPRRDLDREAAPADYLAALVPVKVLSKVVQEIPEGLLGSDPPFSLLCPRRLLLLAPPAWWLPLKLDEVCEEEEEEEE